MDQIELPPFLAERLQGLFFRKFFDEVLVYYIIIPWLFFFCHGKPLFPAAFQIEDHLQDHAVLGDIFIYIQILVLHGLMDFLGSVFVAAPHAVQGSLGNQYGIDPEAE